MIMEKIFTFQAKKKKKSKKGSFRLKSGVFVLGWILLLPLLFYSFYLGLFYQRVYPFITVASFDLTGKNQPEAALSLVQFAAAKKPQDLILVFDDQKWLLDLEKLNLVYDADAAAAATLQVGRQDNLLDNLREQSLAFWQRLNLDFTYQLDEESLDRQIATIAGQLDLAAIPPTIQILDRPDPRTGEKIVVIEGKSGRQLDQDETKSLISRQLSQLENKTIYLPVKELLPKVSQRVVQDTQGRAGKLLGKKIILLFGKESWEIEDKTIINFLSFYQLWDEEKIDSYLSGLAKSINRPPQDALFSFASGRVLEFKPAMSGQTLNEQETQQLITESLNGLENNEKNQLAKINLPVTLTQPKVAMAEVNSLGIKEFLAEGVSWFYGSIPGRIHNIQLAASKLNGLLVAPGETFSFNQAVGDISAATGFKQAYIIQGSRTILGDGGGVCQVSTTLFRALLNAGLVIEERHAHSYRVGYYEYRSDPGFDATVYYPTEDLKFKNDTPAYILIQSYTDTANMKLSFQLYGTADGRQVSLSKAKIWDQVPPPPDLYQDDPTLPLGTVKQVDWKAWGAKVAFDWKVIRGGEVLQEKTFYSSYRPWQAIFLKGTKQ